MRTIASVEPMRVCLGKARSPRWYRERLAELERTAEEISALLDRREVQQAASAGNGDLWDRHVDDDEIEILRRTLLDIGEEMAALREGWRVIVGRSRQTSA